VEVDIERRSEHALHGSPRLRSAGDMGNLLGLTNGVFTGVGGIYLVTRSVAITVIAGCVTLFLVTLVIVRGQ
jgi:hypothetical protein